MAYFSIKNENNKLNSPVNLVTKPYIDCYEDEAMFKRIYSIRKGHRIVVQSIQRLWSKISV